MENRGELQRRVIMELSQGEEFTKQLQRILESAPPPSLSSMPSSFETTDLLVKKVLSSFTVVLSLLKSVESSGAGVASPATGSPLSVSSSPSDKAYHKNPASPFAEHDGQKIRKKRKTLPKWTKQVNLNSDAGPEVLLDDGYSWRKYGQKDILGAAYPRGYYRCTHKFAQGCVATKHVQRSDDNSSVFNITYKGEHTCDQLTHQSPTIPFHESPENYHSLDQPQNFQPELLLNFKTGLKVKTEDLDAKAATSFSFPLEPDNQQQYQQQQTLDPPMSSVSHPFFSPTTTSDSNYYIFSSGVEQPNLHNSESDLTEILSATTSAANSPMLGFDFLETLGLEHDLSFDVEQFF